MPAASMISFACRLFEQRGLCQSSSPMADELTGAAGVLRSAGQAPLACRAMADERPIGMFDSGFGGLTVARALIDLLPGEDLVYVGDTGRYPYGPRPLDQVRAFAHEITKYLLDEHDAKLIVIACNNAAAAALDDLQSSVAVPVIGVIEPGVRSLI